MVDHSEMDNSEDQNMSEYINDKHFINKDDLYDLHSGRQVRRRRSSPEPIIGEWCFFMYLHIFINKYFRTSWFSSNHSSSDTRINQWNWWYYWSEHSSVDWRSERWWAQDEVGEFTEIIQVHDSSDEEEFEHFWEEWIPQRKKIKGNEWDRSDWFTNSSFALAKIDSFR